MQPLRLCLKNLKRKNRQQLHVNILEDTAVQPSSPVEPSDGQSQQEQSVWGRTGWALLPVGKMGRTATQPGAGQPTATLTPAHPWSCQERKTSRKDWPSEPGPSKGTIFVPMMQMPHDALQQPKRFDWHYTLAVHRNTFSILPLHPPCPAWRAPQPCFQKGPEDRQHPGFS